MIQLKHDREGQEPLVKFEIRQFTYNGTFLGERFITTTIESPEPMNFEIGDYLEYRGERFELNYIPPKQKKSTKFTVGDAFVYSDIKFNSLADELTRCDFVDSVMYDNKLHYGISNFSFMATSVSALAERIQANLNRVYTGAKAWTVTVAPNVAAKDVEVKVNSISCWNALVLVNTLFELNFTITGRTILIGASETIVNHIFEYGQGKGLYDLKQTADTEAQIITRLKAYGSTRNMPYKYYFEQGNPNSLAVRNLMLAGYPNSTVESRLIQTGYILNEKECCIDSTTGIAAYGVREGTVYFDGTNADVDNEEIYPSMEGMTAAQLTAAGVTLSLPTGDNGNLDEVLGVDEMPTDDGVIPEEGETPLQGTFKIILKDIGFDISAVISDGVKISMKTGMCVSREFDVTACIVDTTSKTYKQYILTCNRFEDKDIDIAYPNVNSPVAAGDKFVLLELDMPDVYIKAASEKLVTEATKFLAKNDKTKYLYEPTLDEQFIAKNYKDIGAYIIEGNRLEINDTDLGIDDSIIIDTLEIREGDGLLPQYKVTLKNEKTASALEKIRNSIDSLSKGTGTVDEAQIKTLMSLYCLSKRNNDQAQGYIDFIRGLYVGTYKAGMMDGTGGAFLMDANGRSVLEVDILKSRVRAEFTELVIEKLSHVGGQVILSPASMVCSKVDATPTDYYRCFFDRGEDGKAVNQFIVNDQAKCQVFTGSELKYYWRLVVGIGDGSPVVDDKGKILYYNDYIDLSKVNADGESVPATGDNIVQLGYRLSDHPERQNAIILSSYGDDAPSFIQYKNINGFSLANKALTKFSKDENFIVGRLSVVSSNGDVIKVPAERGEWLPDTPYYYYDRVSHNGALWLCIVSEGTSTLLEPTDANSAIWLKQVDKGGIGIDGSHMEFAYISSTTQPTTPTGATIPPTGWSKTPTETSAEALYVWMTQASVSGIGIVGTWSTPIRISGLNGDKGADGTDIEFIYARTATNNVNDLPTVTNSQANDYVPIGWWDNPQGVTASLMYEWVCVRYKNLGVWTVFSTPVVWSKWGEKGMDGDGFEYIYKLTTEEVAPTDVITPPDNSDDYIPEGYTDDPTGVSYGFPYEWVRVRKKKNGVWGAFGAASLWAKWTRDGSYISFAYTASTLTPTLNKNDGNIPPVGWFSQPQATTVDAKYLWMTQAEISGLGDVGVWSDPIRLSGLNGENGADGTDIEFIYQRSVDYTTPTKPTSVQVDDNIPDGWFDNPQGVTADNMYEWVCVRTKTAGVWSVYSTPVVWAKWGEKGMDGDGYEYIYATTTLNEPDDLPAITNSQTDDYVPTGWTDDPTGVSQAKPYEWVCSRKRTNGVWADFGTPVVWAKWGFDGAAGANGIDGTNGVNGTSQYFHVRYSANADGSNMGTTPNTYIGTVVTLSETAPTSYTAYTWVRLIGAQGAQGTQGIAGINGTNGQTSYLHIKYSNDGGTTFTANSGEDVGTYIGQYVDFTLNDSNNVADYRWALIKGADGANGINGTNGVNGTSQYFHVKYSANADGSNMSDTVNTYIGTAVTSSQTPPTLNTDYKWVRLIGAQGAQGTQGIAGINGTNGETSYLHIKYSNDGGVTFTGNSGEDVGKYIGQYVDFLIDDSTNVASYKWALIKGADGVTTYTWIKYADDQYGAGLSDSPTGKEYIGFAYNKTTATESDTASDYTWSLIKGADGVAGAKGADGTTTYTWIKYSDNADGTGLYDTPTSSTLYIGIATNKTTATESSVKTDYIWSKFKGDQGVQGNQGIQGPAGSNALAVRLTGEQVFKYASTTASAPINSDIVLTCTLLNFTGNPDWKYYNGTSWVTLYETGGANPYGDSTYTLNYANSAWGTSKSLRVRCLCNGYYDEMTIVKLYDGSDSYNVILSNESHTVACTNDGTAKSGELGTSGKALTQVLVYKGATLLGTGSWSYGTPVTSNVTIDKTYTAGTVYILTLTQPSGYVDLPINVDGLTITKRFSLTKSLDGISGTSPITAILTNDSAAVPCLSDGSPISYASATGYFKVYDGATEVTNSCTNFSASGTNCSGTINGTTDKGAYALTSLTADTGRLILSCTYNSNTVSKVFSVAKAKGGADGSSPVIYIVEPSTYTVVKSTSGVYTPTAVLFSFYSKTGAGARQTMSGYYSYDFSNDNSSFTVPTNGSGETVSVSPSSSNKIIRCRFFGNDSTRTNVVDTQTVLVVNDGTNGTSPLTAILTNDAAAIPCSDSGNVINGGLAGAVGYLKIYNGATDVTSSCINFTADGSVTGCAGTIDSSGYYALTSINNDTGRLILAATYNSVTVSKVFSVSKVKAGITPYVFEIEPSAYAVVKGITGTLTPSTVTFRFYARTGTGRSSQAGYYTYDFSNDGTTFDGAVNDSGFPSSSVVVTPRADRRFIRCRYFFFDNTHTTAVDTQTVVVVNDGTNGSHMAYLYAMNGSLADAPSLQTTSFTPSGWSSVMPTASFLMYIWRTQALVNDEGTAFAAGTSAWSTPTMISPIAGGAPTGGLDFVMGKTYYGNPQRCDVCKYSNVYYIARADIDKGSFTASATPNNDSTHWNAFGGNFQSLATEFLWADGAIIGEFAFKNGAMVSQSGMIGSSPSTKYTDGSFIPNISLDGKQGIAKLLKAYVGNFKIQDGDIIGLVSGAERIRMTTGAIPALSNVATNQWVMALEGISTLYSDDILSPDGSGNINTSKTYVTGGTSLTLNGGTNYVRVKLPSFTVLYEPYTTSITATITSWTLKLVQGTTTLTTTSPTVGLAGVADGTWTVTLTAVVSFTASGQSNSTSIIPTVGYSAIELQVISNRTLIGNNGIVSQFGATNYMYYSKDDGFETRNGSYGLKVNANGAYKWDGSNWVAVGNLGVATISGAGTYTIDSTTGFIGANYVVSRSSADSVVVVLPQSPTVGREISIRKDSSVNVTVRSYNSLSNIRINGTSASSFTIEYSDTYTVIWDGTYWMRSYKNY